MDSVAQSESTGNSRGDSDKMVAAKEGVIGLEEGLTKVVGAAKEQLAISMDRGNVEAPDRMTSDA